MLMQEVNGARVQAAMVTTGLITFVCVGLAACLALVVAVFYLVVSSVLLLLQASCEVFGALAATWAAADPLLKVLILAAVAWAVYQLWASKRGGKYAK